jgi:murein L,D-transpeptidase YafK
MLIRLFKEESILEVWKKKSNGTYRLLKSYEICTWSGNLGPKFKEGDRQAPEGFYTVTPGLMNPKSSFYLSFNTGFPNKFDRAHGRTGSDLMVHGDCSSRGCYAMTDEQIAEIYAIGRDSFRGGQRSFQLQLYPFRMTPKNFARHRNSEHLDFWKNIKIGYDAFEISKTLPSWDVCEGRYIFNASGGSLSAHGACPASSTKPQLMAKVAAKQKSDFAEFDILVAALDEKEVGRVALEEKREIAKLASAERTAALNAAINQQTNAVGGFFNGLFGGTKPPVSTQITPTNTIMPTPMPRIDR